MHPTSRCRLIAVAVLAVLSLIGSLEIEVAAQTGVQETPVQAVPVNRTPRHHELPVVPSPSSSRPELDEPKLPDGCHPAMSPPKHAFPREVPGRCVS
jgi:hypothetical protein